MTGHRKRNSKRIDKETQSPVFKIFKEMKQRERDQEKARFIKNERSKGEWNKKRVTSKKCHNCKYDVLNSADDSPSPRPSMLSYLKKKRKCPHHPAQYKAMTQPYQENWWETPPDLHAKGLSNDKDTPSSNSCGLKRLLCKFPFLFWFLFIVSVSVALVVIFFYTALFGTEIATVGKSKDSDECLGDDFNQNDDDTFLRFRRRNNKENVWDEEEGSKKDYNTDADLISDEHSYASDSSQAVVDFPTELDLKSLGYLADNEEVREFYKKLIYANEKIKKLKKSHPFLSIQSQKKLYDHDRFKRTAKTKRHTVTGDPDYENIQEPKSSTSIDATEVVDEYKTFDVNLTTTEIPKYKNEDRKTRKLSKRNRKLKHNRRVRHLFNHTKALLDKFYREKIKPHFDKEVVTINFNGLEVADNKITAQKSINDEKTVGALADIESVSDKYNFEKFPKVYIKAPKMPSDEQNNYERALLDRQIILTHKNDKKIAKDALTGLEYALNKQNFEVSTKVNIKASKRPFDKKNNYESTFIDRETSTDYENDDKAVKDTRTGLGYASNKFNYEVSSHVKNIKAQKIPFTKKTNFGSTLTDRETIKDYENSQIDDLNENVILSGTSYVSTHKIKTKNQEEIKTKHQSDHSNTGKGTKIRSRGLLAIDLNREKDDNAKYFDEDPSNIQNKEANELNQTNFNNTIKGFDFYNQLQNVSNDNFMFWMDTTDGSNALDDSKLLKEERVNIIESSLINDTGNNLVNKSRIWLEDIKKKLTNLINTKNLWIRKQQNEEGLQDTHKIFKRKINRKGKDIIDFNKLTSDMEDICRQADRLVKLNSIIDLEDKNKTVLSTTMMQRLMDLLSGLVKTKVRQNECLKLPPSLTEFFDWLMGPSPFKISDSVANANLIQDRDDLTKGTRDRTSNTKDQLAPEFHSTVKIIRDLIEQYHRLSDENQTKMAGVIEYLTKEARRLSEYEQTLRSKE